jgi:hypothetical protein
VLVTAAAAAVSQVSLRAMVACMSPQPQPPCLAVYAAQFSALDVSGSGRLPADSLVDLLSSDTWDLTDVEVRGRGEGGGHIGSDCGCERVLGGCVEFTDWLCDLSRCHTRVPSSTPPHPERCCGAH